MADMACDLSVHMSVAGFRVSQIPSQRDSLAVLADEILDCFLEAFSIPPQWLESVDGEGGNDAGQRFRQGLPSLNPLGQRPRIIFGGIKENFLNVGA